MRWKRQSDARERSGRSICVRIFNERRFGILLCNTPKELMDKLRIDLEGTLAWSTIDHSGVCHSEILFTITEAKLIVVELTNRSSTVFTSRNVHERIWAGWMTESNVSQTCGFVILLLNSMCIGAMRKSPLRRRFNPTNVEQRVQPSR